MGNITSIIHLPAQSGKTRKMTELINRWKNIMSISESSSSNINIIFTSNTKLLAKQTEKRIHDEVDVDKSANSSDLSTISDLSDDEQDDDDDTLSITIDSTDKDFNNTIAWTHSKKCKLSVNDMFSKVTSDDENEINNIICCTNKTRMKHVLDLIVNLNKKYEKKNLQKNLNIWIDEADACISTWEHFRLKCEELGFIQSGFLQNIVLISATMFRVYDHLHSVGIEPNLRTYENTHAPTYHGYHECIICTDYSKNANKPDNHLENILQKQTELLSPGIRLFAPGNRVRQSHEQVCEVLLKNGFNVLILNGLNKEFRMQDGTVICISDELDEKLEIGNILNNKYHELEMYKKPFAVTGNLCVGRGITFASKIDNNEFMFTHGIIPEVTNGDEGYQIVARCCGNIKTFDTYAIPKLFVSERSDKLIREQERVAIDFAKKYFVVGTIEPTIKVTPQVLKDVYTGKNYKTKKEKKEVKERFRQFKAGIVGDMTPFNTLEEANVFCKNIKPNSNQKKEENYRDKTGQFPGKFVTSTTGKLKVYTYSQFMSEMGTKSVDSNLNMDDLKGDDNFKGGKVSKVIKPLYTDDSYNTVVWWVRWAVHKDNINGNTTILEALKNKK
jgi:hypothetical protein